MRPLPSPAAATDLAGDQFLHWPSGPAGRLCVHDGTVWLTVDGEADDHVLEGGQCIDLPPRRHALLQPLGDHARVSLGRRDRVAA